MKGKGVGYPKQVPRKQRVPGRAGGKKETEGNADSPGKAGYSWTRSARVVYPSDS